MQESNICQLGGALSIMKSSVEFYARRESRGHIVREGPSLVASLSGAVVSYFPFALYHVPFGKLL